MLLGAYDIALLKSLYLATFEATKKWTLTTRNWAQVYSVNILVLQSHLSRRNEPL